MFPAVVALCVLILSGCETVENDPVRIQLLYRAPASEPSVSRPMYDEECPFVLRDVRTVQPTLGVIGRGVAVEGYGVEPWVAAALEARGGRWLRGKSSPQQEEASEIDILKIAVVERPMMVRALVVIRRGPDDVYRGDAVFEDYLDGSLQWTPDAGLSSRHVKTREDVFLARLLDSALDRAVDDLVSSEACVAGRPNDVMIQEDGS